MVVRIEAGGPVMPCSRSLPLGKVEDAGGSLSVGLRFLLFASCVLHAFLAPSGPADVILTLCDLVPH